MTATHRRATWALGIAASLLVLTGCGNAGSPSEQTSSSEQMGALPTSEITTPGKPVSQDKNTPQGVPAEAQKAEVRRIVDGDTLELAAVAAGAALASTSQVDVRLLEIDTPETKHPDKPVQCYGPKATNHLKELAPPGSTVWVQRDEELKDRYGRYLLYLWNSEGRFVNLAMVEDGYAKAELYMPNDKYWDTIRQAGTEAQTANVGLWGACPYFGAPKNTPEPEPQPEPEPEPQPEPQPEPEPDTDSYLFPPPPPDKDCGDVSANNFRVRPGDPHRFDSDGDGIGCES